ncbi:hypothetical protein GCM10011585_17530 [Edaphobacter dinghuensis]|uniref:Uncharacterized protein n=1 Tax=Edaphobacter dinghuensis TaxID=1560005 RepID=A0A917M3D9_9BACT|nr:hypothetical protein GCM10011585_17530 [Edaphobacter dinghuensis]
MFTVFTQQCWNAVGSRDGLAVGKNDMATDPKRWIGMGNCDGIAKGCASGHQCG